METFSALLVLYEGNSPVTGEFPSQRPVTRSFDVFFDLRLNIWLSKQSGRWWFETSSRSLWRHCDVQSVKFEWKCNNCDSRTWIWKYRQQTFCHSSSASLCWINAKMNFRRMEYGYSFSPCGYICNVILSPQFPVTGKNQASGFLRTLKAVCLVYFWRIFI